MDMKSAAFEFEKQPMRERQHEAMRDEKVTVVIVRWVRVGEVCEGGHVETRLYRWVHACLHIVILLTILSFFFFIWVKNKCTLFACRLWSLKE